MEGERYFETWKLLLRVQVGRRRDNPPSLLIGVNIPNVDSTTQHPLRLYFLKLLYSLARLHAR
jgi:hypothetical protein